MTKKVVKVLARMPDGCLLSAVEHGCGIEYIPGQKTVSPHGPLFAFDNTDNARAFAEEYSVSFRYKNGLELWMAEAENPRRVRCCLYLHHVTPGTARIFWTDSPCSHFNFLQLTFKGTVVCDSVTLLRKIEEA